MFVQRVRQAMEEKGISQADLVKLTGISKGSISQYLSGKNMPRPDKIKAIANALNVSPDWLVEGDCKNITVKQAADLMGVSQQFIRIGLQQEKLPIGTAVQISGTKYTYYISPKKFSEYTGIKLNQQRR